MNPNTYYNQKVRGQKRKLDAIITLGGKCANHGYCKNISAMEFHHLDKNEKEFQLDTRKFANTTPEKLKLELAKCSILCSNCHKEIHHPELTFSYVKDLTEISSK